jgi:hypothetical protein
MGMILGEIRALLGLIGAAFGIRRRRTILLERRQRLDDVFREAGANLDGIRRVWSEEHNRLNWRAWLHGDLLRTRAWREHKAFLTTGVDGGAALDDKIASDLDALYRDLEDAGANQSFSSDWEGRLVDVAAQLRDQLQRYPHRWWNRAAMKGAPPLELAVIDPRIRTPSSPAEMQRRALERLCARDG